jgi:pyruvyl transferase EpsO
VRLQHAFAVAAAARLERVIAPLLTPGRPVALVNFPNHNNPGDNAIWLAAKALLRRLGVPIAYTCSPVTFDDAAMRAAVGDGPLLLNGGGNFGDVYRGQQRLREHVLEHCLDRHVVQLPQTIWFRDPQNAARMGALCRSHPRFTLIVRDPPSERIATEIMGLRPVLAPDLALALGPLRRRVQPRIPVLWLGRNDPEATNRPAPPPDIPFVDWVEAPLDADFSASERAVLAENQRLRACAVDGDISAKAASAQTFDPLARAWVRRGLDILSSARVIITDRLHAHELATLLGIPHVVLDNANGKVRAIFETWNRDSGIAQWAETTEDAVALARGLLRAQTGGATASGAHCQ